MLMDIEQIHQYMNEHTSEKAKESWIKFTPSRKKVWGIYLADINPLVKKIRPEIKENQVAALNIIRELWKGTCEEQILAAKLLEFVNDFDIEEFIPEITDWAVCDTLATQGLRKIAKKQPQRILQLSKKLVKNDNFWTRRFGLVILINLIKNPEYKQEIKQIAESLSHDKEHYVKKAVMWIKRDLEK